MGVSIEHQIITREQQLQLLSPVAVTSPTITDEEAECLQELRRLIKDDSEMCDLGVDQDEEFLLAFVRGKRCNHDKAFKTLQNYIRVRKVKYPEYFQALSPTKWAYLLDRTHTPRFFGLLKNTDCEGRFVGVCLCSLFNPAVQKGDDVFEAFVTAGLEILRTDVAPRTGLVFVMNASGFGLNHAREITMFRVYFFLKVFLGSYPVKHKAFHVLNNGYLFNPILAIVKQLLPKKLRDRIHLHGNNFASLHEHVPREILPESFGGLLPDEEAYNTDFEQRKLGKTEYYEKMARYW